MKKIVISTLAIAMMMTMAACSSSDNDVVEISGENQTGKKTFTAICENSVGTRAKLDSESGKKVLWEEGDKIGINGYEYALEGGAGTTNGLFGGFSEHQSRYIAVYPYNGRWAPSSNFDALSIPFPSEQEATEGTFDKDAALMVAYSDDGSNKLEFKNVGALVKVKLKFNCKKIVLNAGDESVPLAGKGTLSYNGGNPTYTINSDKAYSITLSGDIKSDKTYYIAVPAVKLNAGWSISFVDKNDDNVYTRRGSNDIEFKRNYIIDLGEFYSSTAQTSWTGIVKKHGRVNASAQVDMGLTITKDEKIYKVIFAKFNLISGGLASKESDYGDYFAWGATAPLYSSYSRTITGTTVSVSSDSWLSDKNEGYVWKNTPFINETNDACTQYTNEDSQLASADDAANFYLAENWQIPTKEIWVKLYDGGTGNYTWLETTVDGYKGYKVISKSNNNWIFLPYAGCFIGTECKYTNSRGHYWSNSAKSNITASYIFSATNNTIYPEGSGSCSRCYGFSIRPVHLVEVNN